jgi:endonuclease VIII
MPEGDTIFRAARALNKALGGKRVSGFESVLAQLSRVDTDAPIKGRTVQSVRSTGKWILMHFSGDLILVTHMLMSGSWHIYRPGEQWRMPPNAMRIVVETADLVAVAFSLQIAEFHTQHSLERHPKLRQLGPDLLGGEYDAEKTLALLRQRSDWEIGSAMLDQRVMAGVGNVFKSEILFACGINPFAHISSLSHTQLVRLVSTSRKLLNDNAGDDSGDRITTYLGFRRTTGRSDPSARLWVYGRRGQLCRRCGTVIAYGRQGTEARATFWCPKCQPADFNS